jgi:hypothetical protein
MDRAHPGREPQRARKSLTARRLRESEGVARGVLQKAAKNWSAGRGGTLPGLPILAAGGIVPPAFFFAAACGAT